MNESQIKKTRDELFELRLTLAKIKRKTNVHLYGKEIIKLEQEIEETKKKMARQKIELLKEGKTK